jgi:pre-mRNA-splicing factor SPF27
MSDELLVDALPYFDSGYDEPGVKQAVSILNLQINCKTKRFVFLIDKKKVLALIEEECRRYKPTKNYLESIGSTNLHKFETDIMKNEFSRLEQNQPMEMLSMKRYELPPPPTGKQTEVSAWQESVDNSLAQLEHQAIRIMNLELMSDYGPNAWREYIKTLQNMFDEAQHQLNTIKNQIQSVNLQRKNEQTEAGERLRSLEHNWVSLVSKNYEIECAIVELEKEVNELRKEKETQEQSQSSSETTQKNENIETLKPLETTNEDESMETSS